MKKHILQLTLTIGILTLAIAGGKDKLTIKEKIDKAGTVNVYFTYYPMTIGHNLTSENCPPLNDQIEYSDLYKAEQQNVVDLLNEGFETDAFIIGNLENIPQEEKLITLERDWSKDGKDITIELRHYGIFSLSDVGENNINMMINTMFNIFEINKGDSKKIKSKQVATIRGTALQPVGCIKDEYFKNNLKLDDHIEQYKTKINEKLTKVIGDIMADHKKALKKRKK